jgi:hypothetical protein
MRITPFHCEYITVIRLYKISHQQDIMKSCESGLVILKSQTYWSHAKVAWWYWDLKPTEVMREWSSELKSQTYQEENVIKPFASLLHFPVSNPFFFVLNDGVNSSIAHCEWYSQPLKVERKYIVNWLGWYTSISYIQTRVIIQRVSPGGTYIQHYERYSQYISNTPTTSCLHSCLKLRRDG